MRFLSDVVAGVRRNLEHHPLDDGTLLARAMSMPPARDLAAALRGAPSAPAIIAEVKRASPSAGPIAEGDAGTQARAYEAAGASAVSVLTEGPHFDGSLADLRAARLATSLPVLRKDFLVHPSQVIESRAVGADAVLLIAAALPALELEAMLAAAKDVGLSTLVEAHSDADLDRAVASGADVIGVNSRDLETLAVDVDAALARVARVPSDRVAVLESGIAERADVVAALEAGASAVLIGEALMRAQDAGAKLRELLGVGDVVV